MLNIDLVLKSNLLMLALTGMQVHEFLKLLTTCEKIFLETCCGITRKRAFGAGRKGVLRNAQMKLLELLRNKSCIVSVSFFMGHYD